MLHNISVYKFKEYSHFIVFNIIRQLNVLITYTGPCLAVTLTLYKYMIGERMTIR